MVETIMIVVKGSLGQSKKGVNDNELADIKPLDTIGLSEIDQEIVLSPSTIFCVVSPFYLAKL